MNVYGKSYGQSTVGQGGSNWDQRRFDRLAIKANDVGGAENLSERQRQKLSKYGNSLYGTDGKSLTSDELTSKMTERVADLSKATDEIKNKPFYKNVLSNSDLMSTVGTGVSNVLMGDKRNESISSTQQTIQDLAFKGLNMWIPGLGTAAQLWNSAQYALGNNFYNPSRELSDAANLNTAQKIGNDIVSTFGTVSGLAFLAPKTIGTNANQEVLNMGGSYGDTVGKIGMGTAAGGQRILFGAGNMNNMLANNNMNNHKLWEINRANTLPQSVEDRISETALKEGGNPIGRTYAKNGMKLGTPEEMRKLLQQCVVSEDIVYLQDGGVIGIDTNILPEGALHRELNDLDDVKPEIGEEVTRKGIPVIVTDSECNIEQVAEIEKEEIILRKELTVKVEKLWKDGSEEAMIEAGKLLTDEIITNTQDNTGQLENGI